MITYFKSIGFLFVVLILASCAAALKPEATLSQDEIQQNIKSQLSATQNLLQTKQAILDLDSTRIHALIDAVDVNTPLPDGSSLLAWAVETQEPMHVALLLNNGAKLQSSASNRFTPLIIACSHGNAEIISLLLDHGANPNVMLADNTSAFQLCAGSTSVSILEEMIERGADVNQMNALGQTALMWAAHSGLTQNMQVLIANGASINQKTHEGYSALFFAIRNHQLEAAQFLLNNDADILAKTSDGTSAAQLAVYVKNHAFLIWLTNNLSVVMTPEEMRATLTAFDRNGHQLLHAAVLANQPALVSALLRQGANNREVSGPSKLKWRYEANFKTQDYEPPKMTPLQFAKKYGFEQIVSLLTSHEFAVQ